MRKLNWFVHFLLALAIVAGALPAFGTVVFINSVQGGAASTGAAVTIPTTGTMDISASNAFFICASNQGNQSITVSSSPNMGTFLSLPQQHAGTGSAGNGAMQLWYILNPAVSTTQTVTVNGSIASLGVVGMWFSGVGAIDQSNGTTSSPSGSGTWTTASVTPTYNNELIISCTTEQAAHTMSIGSSFIIPTNGQLLGTYTYQTLGAYLIQTTGAGTPVAPNITYSGAATSMSGTNATFQAVASNANAVPYIARSHLPVPTLTGLPWHDLFAWLF